MLELVESRLHGVLHRCLDERRGELQRGCQAWSRGVPGAWLGEGRPPIAPEVTRRSSACGAGCNVGPRIRVRGCARRLLGAGEERHERPGGAVLPRAAREACLPPRLRARAGALRDSLHARRRRRGVVADQNCGGPEVSEDEEDPHHEAVRAAAGGLEEAGSGVGLVVMIVSPVGGGGCRATSAARVPRPGSPWLWALREGALPGRCSRGDRRSGSGTAEAQPGIGTASPGRGDA